MSEPFTLSVRRQLFLVQPPQTEPGNAVYLCLHGLTGDEHSMEIFTRRPNQNGWIIYPRAFYPASKGGYSWVEQDYPNLPPRTAFQSSTASLHLHLDLLLTDLGIPQLPVHLMGFSQGAAQALVFAETHFQAHRKIALLAGFLPEGSTAQPVIIAQLSFFVSHGRNDATIPIQKAHELVNYLNQTGADVKYCESNAGHKFGVECLKPLNDFMVR